MPTKSGPENIAHCVSVRMSAFGLGSLRTRLHSFNGIKSVDLSLTVLQPTGDIFPTNVANFKSQRMCIMFYTTDINQYFTIGKIIAFVKPVAVGYPQWT